MKNNLILICPGEQSHFQVKLNNAALENKSYRTITCVDELSSIKNGKIIFSVYIDSSGINIELMKMLRKISLMDKDFFKNSSIVLFVIGDSELFTKSISRKIILYSNLAGASFIGRPIIEATGSMKNLVHLALSRNLELEEVCIVSAKELVERMLTDVAPKNKSPKLLVLHSSNILTSNTLMLWEKVKEDLSDIEVAEIHIENGAVKDCIGCPYKTCNHYGQQQRCYYGGIMVSDIYPAILNCDAILLLCPNYNDSISANMSAVINRLTALFRMTQFYDKYLFSIIVSGHSGSDLLAEQLISALNINKTFRLPSNFTMMETANNPGDVLKLLNIDNRVTEFSKNIIKTLYKQ